MKTLLLSILIIISTISQTPHELVDRYVKDGLDKGTWSPFNGAVLVAKNNKILLKESHGYSDFKTKKKLSVDSKFLIGSVTKQFTALLVLQELEKGSLKLNHSVSDLLPYFPKNKGKHLTINRLLTHTSGLPHYEGIKALGYTEKSFFNKRLTPKEYALLISKVDLFYSPDTRFYYSSLGYVLLGVILEEVTGKSYSDLIKERITIPLDLKHTGYASNTFVQNNVVNDYVFKEYGIFEGFFEEFEGTYTNAPFRDQSNTYSTGGMYSTVEDLYKWTKALKESKLLNPKFTQMMFSTNEFGYHFGWFRNPETMFRRNPSAPFFHHGGKVTGYTAQVAMYDDNTTIIILSNVSELNISRITRELHLSANNIAIDSFKRDLVRPEIEESLSDFITDGGMDAYKNYYRALSERAGYPIYPSAHAVGELITLYSDKIKIREIVNEHLERGMIKDRDAMIILGNALLDKECYNLAVDIFKMNTELYPLSALTYYYLGNAYKAKNDIDNAKKSYKKAVEIGEKISSRSLPTYKKKLKELS